MSESMKLRAGADMPALALPKVGGGSGWQLVVVFRGKHCPRCRKHLKTLDELFDEFTAASTAVVAISGDSKEKAESQAAEARWRFPVGYGLTAAQMRALGFYISEPRSMQETDRPFPEPGLFVVNPDGMAQIIDVADAPVARPALSAILAGVKFVREKSYPIRGTVS